MHCNTHTAAELRKLESETLLRFAGLLALDGPGLDDGTPYAVPVLLRPDHSQPERAARLERLQAGAA